MHWLEGDLGNGTEHVSCSVEEGVESGVGSATAAHCCGKGDDNLVIMGQLLHRKFFKESKLFASSRRQRFAIKCLADLHVKGFGNFNLDFSAKRRSGRTIEQGQQSFVLGGIRKGERVGNDGCSIHQCERPIDVVTKVGGSTRNPELPEKGVVVDSLLVTDGVRLVDVFGRAALPLEDVSLVFDGPKAALLTGYVETLPVGWH